MKINTNDKNKIQETINEAEKGCTARTLDYDDLLKAIAEAEKKLTTLEIPKKTWVGCTVEIEPEKVTNSYRGRAHGTYAAIERFASGWFMVRCSRIQTGSCSFGEGKRHDLNLTVEAKAAIPSKIVL